MRVRGDSDTGSLHGHRSVAVTTTEGIHAMEIVDKAENAAQDVAGTAKEHAGRVTGDDVKKAGDNIKDAFKN